METRQDIGAANENVPESPKKKKSGWAKFGNFLMMGGFLLVLVVGVIIAVLISLLFS